MPQPLPPTPEPVFDAFWFPLFAEIIIPSLVGAGTIAVAVIAAVVSNNARKQAKKAAQEVREQELKALRSEFVATLQGRTSAGSAGLRHQEVVTGQGSETITQWRSAQITRLRSAGVPHTDPQTLLETPIQRAFEATVTRRCDHWVESGNFDSSDIDLATLSREAADPPAGD